MYDQKMKTWVKTCQKKIQKMPRENLWTLQVEHDLVDRWCEKNKWMATRVGCGRARVLREICKLSGLMDLMIFTCHFWERTQVDGIMQTSNFYENIWRADCDEVFDKLTYNSQRSGAFKLHGLPHIEGMLNNQSPLFRVW
jgi:hypothetical protein